MADTAELMVRISLGVVAIDLKICEFKRNTLDFEYTEGAI
jgi:hypothetical protein